MKSSLQVKIKDKSFYTGGIEKLKKPWNDFYIAVEREMTKDAFYQKKLF